MPVADELRLLFTLALTALVFASAYAFARRLGAGGRLQATCDALLLGLVIQYLAVALPGAAGVLNVATMSVVALAACAACWFAALRNRRPHGDAFADADPHSAGSLSAVVLFLRGLSRPDRLGFLAAGLFTVAYTGVYAYQRRWFPVFNTDALVYHLPEAVQWMQTGRLGLFDTWYWNPAATYSPATTGTFTYWLLAPMGNDVLARNVQTVPLLLIFLVAARLARVLGCGLTVAGCVGAAAALSRPLFSQVLDPKDDLTVTAFFACAVLSLSGDNPRDRLGPWRAGLAFGMVLASKYTVLLVCPLFLFMIDAPFRAIRGRASVSVDEGTPATPSRVRPRVSPHALRYWILAVLVALALALPWYLRTWFVTGNPLFPVDVKLFGRTVFPGLFTTERDQELRSASGVWKMVSATYHSLTVVPLTVLVVGYLAALAGAGRSMLRDPLTRACLIGTPVTLAVFLLASPHHEVRYLFPLLPLWFAAGGLAITRWVPWAAAARVGLAVVFAGVSAFTSFNIDLIGYFGVWIATSLAIAAAGVAAAIGLSQLARGAPSAVARTLAISGGVAAALLAMVLYVEWPGYVAGYRAVSHEAWRGPQAWPLYADAWNYVRTETPDDATIAFANTAYVYPLYGFDLSRKVVYAPVRPEIKRFTDVPRLGDTVPGDLILDAMTAVQNADADRATWLANLRALGAGFVLIHRRERSPNPPELRFAAQSTDALELAYEDEHAAVYRVK